MTKSERLRRRIIWHLRHVWQWADGDGNCWKSFDKLAAELGEPVGSVKRETRRMARDGRLKYSFATDGDGCPHGSGYFLTWGREGWTRHVPGRPEDPADDEFTWEAPNKYGIGIIGSFERSDVALRAYRARTGALQGDTDG
jgi:hypothetical protein